MMLPGSVPQFPEAKMGYRLIAAWCVLNLIATAVSAAPKPVRIDFDSTAVYKESSGTQFTAQASGLLAADRAAVMNVAQGKFDDLLGVGKVTLFQGTGGDIDIIMNGASTLKYG